MAPAYGPTGISVLLTNGIHLLILFLFLLCALLYFVFGDCVCFIYGPWVWLNKLELNCSLSLGQCIDVIIQQCYETISMALFMYWCLFPEVLWDHFDGCTLNNTLIDYSIGTTCSLFFQVMHSCINALPQNTIREASDRKVEEEIHYGEIDFAKRGGVQNPGLVFPQGEEQTSEYSEITAQQAKNTPIRAELEKSWIVWTGIHLCQCKHILLKHLWLRFQKGSKTWHPVYEINSTTNRMGRTTFIFISDSNNVRILWKIKSISAFSSPTLCFHLIMVLKMPP